MTVPKMLGRRDVARFVGDRQKRQLADLVKPILGRPVQIEIEELPHGLNQDGNASQKNLSQDDRANVMDLPLVKRILERFDVSLIDVRPNLAPFSDDESSDGQESKPN